ncbi:MAG TPA: hypothetical protein VMT52_15510 [Planctomycetota bacterium]|nr:hypothetical protein [Planctomycetota bacterium]
MKDGPPCRRTGAPQRSVVFLIAAFLLIGCGIVTLVPVDETFEMRRASLRFSKEHTPFAAGDVIFSHSVHSFETCDRCHFGTASEETTGIPPPRDLLAPPPGAPISRAAALPPEPPSGQDVVLPAMAVCFQCHDGQNVSNGCITCHSTTRRDRKPGFHDGIFPRHHRDMAESEAYKCALCHIQGDCKACHAERKPVSHTPRFERSSHGRLATHDRRSCATCHETAFCENCHSQPPPDHTAAFRVAGGHKQAALLRARSCTVCHSYADACSGCHG